MSLEKSALSAFRLAPEASAGVSVLILKVYGNQAFAFYLAVSESIMERIRITENAMKMIWSVLTLFLSGLSTVLICFLFFDFLLAIFSLTVLDVCKRHLPLPSQVLRSLRAS